MKTSDLRDALLHAKNSGHFFSEAQSIVERLKKEGAGLESVTGILEFIEEHPNFDFGSPGPLAHFIERFHRQGYETALLASIKRRPTVPTLLLLNRLINGTMRESERRVQIDALRQSQSHPFSDGEVKRLAAHYLERLAS